MKLFTSQRKKFISFVLAFAIIISIFSIMPLTVSASIGDVFTADGFTYTVTDEIYGSYSVNVTGFDNSSTEVVIPEKVTNINNGIEYSVTEIGKTVFQGNTDIVSVSIPGTVKKTSASCFKNCTSIKNIILNEGVEWIVASTFNNTAIEEIKLPKSLTKISNYAFGDCPNLKDIYINSNADISASVFNASKAIENVYCYSNNTVFSYQTLGNTNNSLIIHGYTESTAETYANQQGFSFKVIQNVDPSTEVTEPSTEVTEPSTEVTEPSTEVTEPSTEVTEPSTEVTEPTTEPDTSIFRWKKTNNDTAVEITGLKEDYNDTLNIEIPSEINGLPVTIIGASAFQSSRIQTLYIPSSVIVINDSAFRFCNSLKTVTFAEDSQLQKIGNEAFARSAGDIDTLNEVVLPASLKLVGYRAFHNRANLLTVKVLSKDVAFGDSVKGKEVFALIEGESNLRLYGYTDSTTEAYAAEAGHKFRYLDLNTEELQVLYDKAEAIDASLYTKESYDALAAQMKAAKRMIANRDATPQMVNDCIKELQAAIDGLVEYVEPSTTEPETTVPVEYIEYILGDVDGTEGISIDDATAIQMHAAELVELKGADLFAANINDDENIDIQDVTLIQMWIAEYEEAMAYKIGEKFVKEVVPTQPTEPLPTDPQPTGPDEETFTFYLPNYVSWLTDMGGKMWIYNNETEEFLLLEYDGDEELFFYDDLPVSWTDIGLYRTPYETTEEEFDIHDDWNEEAQTGVILNKWENLGDRGDNNCFKITGDGEGFYTMYDPDDNQDDERTIYFDNSNTQWSAVYIYGWSFGIYQEFIPLENEGNDIWSYTFYDELPVDGVKGFLFVDQPSWSGATQTNDLATEEGKNIFVPTPGGQKLNGKWDVYNP